MIFIDRKILARLQQFDTPTVCNVIEVFNVRPRDEGYADGRLKALFPEMPPVVGYAATARFQSCRTDSDEAVSYSSLVGQVAEFLEKIPEPRIVVFEDVDSPPVGATFGEVMCSVYKAFGCVGLITSGAARDLVQVRAMGFPCWCSTMIASHAYCRILETDVPVTIGGLKVQPGDLIHADANGIAAIPKELAREIALGCGLVAEAENEVMHYVRSGKPTVEGLRECNQRWKDGCANVPARVRALLDSGTV